MGQVNFRMKDERQALIDQAATIRGVTRTEFMLRSSEAVAINLATYALFPKRHFHASRRAKSET